MTTDLRARLADARLYLCTDGRRERGDLAGFLAARPGTGVDIVQLREKGLEAGEELALLEVFAAACRRHGALLAVNDRADVALAAGADVLHLGQRQLLARLEALLPQLDDVHPAAEDRVEELRQVALGPPPAHAQVEPGVGQPGTQVGHPVIMPHRTGRLEAGAASRACRVTLR